MTREEQTVARRNEIIAKSVDIFISKGYAATKISDIASAVNMSTGLMFHYFPSKEALYETLIDHGIMGTQSVMRSDPAQGLDFFRQAAETILGLHETMPYAVKMFTLMGQALNNTGLPERIRQKLDGQINNVQQSVPIIQRCQAEGTIKEGDPLALSIAFWCSIQGIMETLALYPDSPAPKAEWVIDILKK